MTTSTECLEWKLQVSACIRCGIHLGYFMQKTPKQLYFYCDRCVKDIYAHGKNLEDIFNTQQPAELNDSL
jgi:hypothetical protein